MEQREQDNGEHGELQMRHRCKAQMEHFVSRGGKMTVGGGHGGRSSHSRQGQHHIESR